MRRILTETAKDLTGSAKNRANCAEAKACHVTWDDKAATIFVMLTVQPRTV